MVLKIINLKIDNINERGQDIKKRLKCGIIVRLPSEKVHETVKSLALEFRKKFECQIRFRIIPRELISKAVRIDKLSRIVTKMKEQMAKNLMLNHPHFQSIVKSNPKQK